MDSLGWDVMLSAEKYLAHKYKIYHDFPQKDKWRKGKWRKGDEKGNERL